MQAELSCWKLVDKAGNRLTSLGGGRSKNDDRQESEGLIAADSVVDTRRCCKSPIWRYGRFAQNMVSFLHTAMHTSIY
jgi:hypothetical protein